MAIPCQGQINPRNENKIIFNKNTNHQASGSPETWWLGWEFKAKTDGIALGRGLALLPTRDASGVCVAHTPGPGPGGAPAPAEGTLPRPPVRPTAARGPGHLSAVPCKELEI